MAFDPTVLTDVFAEVIKRFNDPADAGKGDYDSLGDLFDPSVEIKEVDPPGPSHTTKVAAVTYLKTTQGNNKPQFNISDSKVSDAGTIGIIAGHGTYQDKSTGANPPASQKVLYCLVFERPAVNQNWLLTLGFASLQ